MEGWWEGRASCSGAGRPQVPLEDGAEGLPIIHPTDPSLQSGSSPDRDPDSSGLRVLGSAERSPRARPCSDHPQATLCGSSDSLHRTGEAERGVQWGLNAGVCAHLSVVCLEGPRQLCDSRGHAGSWETAGPGPRVPTRPGHLPRLPLLRAPPAPRPREGDDVVTAKERADMPPPSTHCTPDG